ncbi:hypothetical protein CR513_34762, partial [Mucuna pruriens]
MIEDQLPSLEEWVLPMNQELDNWTVETLLKLIDNTTLGPNNANKSSGQDEGKGPEEEALEGLKLQSRAEELEIINLDEKEEA